MNYSHIEKAKSWADQSPDKKEYTLKSIAHSLIAIAEIEKLKQHTETANTIYLKKIAEELKIANRLSADSARGSVFYAKKYLEQEEDK